MSDSETAAILPLLSKILPRGIVLPVASISVALRISTDGIAAGKGASCQSAPFGTSQGNAKVAGDGDVTEGLAERGVAGGGLFDAHPARVMSKGTIMCRRIEEPNIVEDASTPRRISDAHVTR